MTTIRTVDRLTDEEIGQLADLLVATVADGASVGWLPPLLRQDALTYWRQVVKPETLVFLAETEGKVAGTVQLHLESRANGRHRGEIAKLMVSPEFRRRGIGRQLMDAAEAAAREQARTLLVLDTRAGDPSNVLYQAVGFVEAGRIPRYALAATGELADTVIYYREL